MLGKYYYEATVTDEGLCRVGWSTDLAALDLGQLVIIKMISAQHSSNNMAKIKLPEKPCGMLLFWSQLIRTYLELSSQADPARTNWTWSCPFFTSKRHFAPVKNTITHALSILTMFDI